MARLRAQAGDRVGSGRKKRRARARKGPPRPSEFGTGAGTILVASKTSARQN